MHLRPDQLGILESIRELPGFLVVILAAVTMRVAEPVLASIAISLFAVGLAAYRVVYDLPTLIVCSLIWSIGMHTWMPLQPSMTLAVSEEHSKGRRLGQISAAGALGSICGMMFVLAVGKLLGFRNIFLIAGGIAAVGAVAISIVSRDIGHKQKPRLIIKRRYSLYYTLVFLEGCRKQIFLTFAVFALVRNYGTPLQIVAALMVLNNVINLSLAPHVGRLIDRIGERHVLLFCYLALIPVFIGYATITRPGILYTLYCLDNLFFLGSIGLTTYIHRIADASDVMPTLAMGVSANHAAAVIVPLAGGFIWANFGYQLTFLAGAVIVAVSSLVVLRIRSSGQKPTPSEDITALSEILSPPE